MARFSYITERAALGLALAVISVGATGCMELFAKEPIPDLGGQVLIQPANHQERRAGSLWRNQANGNQPFADVTARYPGDLLTILVTEDDSGEKAAVTDTSRESNVFAAIQQFFGFPQELQDSNSSIDPEQLIKASSKWNYDASGLTSRKGRLTARITVEVKAISPTGNLWVQGDKIVSVNNEDQHVVLTGWVRPTDISAGNEIESTRIADARIEYYGKGPVGRLQHTGWGLTVLDWVWPF